MKKEHGSHKKQHANRRSHDLTRVKPEVSLTTEFFREESAKQPTSIFSRITGIFKKKEKINQEEAPEQQTSQGQPPKLELDQEVRQLMQSQNDTVTKLYHFDLMLRKYYAKEYKIDKKLPYGDMMAQLEEMQLFSQANLIKKTIEYAYSGKALEDQQMRELLYDFQHIMKIEVARKQREKDAHKKHKTKNEATEQEALAPRLQPIAAQLPPSRQPFLQVPVIDTQKYRNKIHAVFDTIMNIRPLKMFARAQLPQPMKKLHSSQKHQVAQGIHIPHPHWPHIGLPKIPHVKNQRTKQGVFGFLSTSRISFAQTPCFSSRASKQNSLSIKAPKLHLRKYSFPKIHVPTLHLPKVSLPYINLHESHAPRHKLSPYKKLKQKISHLHMPHFHIPQIHLSHPHISNVKSTMRHRGLKAVVFFKLPDIRKMLHLPRFHPMLYYERIKEHIPEIHPSEYIRSVTDHIPRLHPHEYYESVKEKLHDAWEKIHPPKPTEEELSLQAEIAEEQAAQEAATRQETAPEPQPARKQEARKQERKVKIPALVVVEQEKFWIEYKPRHHSLGLQHHFAHEIDDIHHIKKILKQHHKANLI